MPVTDPSPFWGVETEWIDDVTEISGDEMKQFRGAAESTAVGALQALGPGVVPLPDSDSLLVTAGTGLAVNVAVGACIAFSDDYGAVVLQSTVPLVGLDVEPSETVYLFAQILVDTGTDADSRRDRGISFIFNDTGTLADAVLLAKIVSDTDSVTVTDLRRWCTLMPDLMRPAGDWNAATAYLKNAVVKHASAYWLSLQASVSQEPENGSTYWDLIGTSVDGSQWRDGSGAPSNSLGGDGDYYLDNDTGDYYKKSGGAYSLRGNLTGPQGEQGFSELQGHGPPDDELGRNGDAYYDIDSADYWTKAVDAWTLQSNRQGPVGPAGADGATGGSWNWIDGGWVTATAYEVDDALAYGSPASSYRCSVDHTSGATTEPGIGIDWETVWDVVAGAGEPGADGAQQYDVSGTPSSGLGVDGDWAFDHTNLRYYRKESGAWSLKVTIPTALARLQTTATSSPNTVGTGLKTFAVPNNMNWTAGLWVQATSSTNNAAWMIGQIATYTAGTPSVVIDFQYTGPDLDTTSTWRIGPAAPPETAGGGVSGPGSSVDGNLAAWDGTGGASLQDSGIAMQ